MGERSHWLCALSLLASASGLACSDDDAELPAQADGGDAGDAGATGRDGGPADDSASPERPVVSAKVTPFGFTRVLVIEPLPAALVPLPLVKDEAIDPAHVQL